MVLRMSLIYAALEGKIVKGKLKGLTIGVDHLKAAKAVWDYCEASAQMLFHSETGDKLCDKLLRILGNGPKTTSDFRRHLTAADKRDLKRKLEKLEEMKLIKQEKVEHEGPGARATVWELCDPA